MHFTPLSSQDSSDDVVFEPSIAQAVAGIEQINFTYRSNESSGNTGMIIRASFISTDFVSTSISN